jgi:hypothetical protein
MFIGIMVKTIAVQVRLTKDEHMKLKLNAQIKGFAKLAEYVRFMTLHQESQMYKMLSELHAHALGSQQEALPGKSNKNDHNPNRSVPSDT